MKDNQLLTKNNQELLMTIESGLLWLWMIVALLGFFRFLLQLNRVQSIIDNGSNYQYKMMNKSLRKKIESTKIQLIRSGECTVPFLAVTLSRVLIVLPDNFLKWKKQDVEMIIAHEVCHYNRNDHWSIWLSELTCILLWFNPFVYYLTKRHRVLVELACDNNLLSDGLDASEYALLLLKIPQNKFSSSLVPFIANGNPPLKERIFAVMDRTEYAMGRIALSSVFILIVSVFIIACGNYFKPTNVDDLVKFISHDLHSLRDGGLKTGHIHIATFYDGKVNSNVFVKLEIEDDETKSKAWLKIGPLKKFTKQIQSWHFKTINQGRFTGRFQIVGAVDDGIVDGVAMGYLYSDQEDQMQIVRSSEVMVNSTPNIVCSWPLGMSDNKITKLTPQISKYNAESIKRLICGAQLLKNGDYL